MDSMYLVTVTEIEKVPRKRYVGKDATGADADGYAIVDGTEERRTEIYSQRVSEIDLVSVIRSVNGVEQ